jgi:hypothetical protein
MGTTMVPELFASMEGEGCRQGEKRGPTPLLVGQREGKNRVRVKSVRGDL